VQDYINNKQFCEFTMALSHDDSTINIVLGIIRLHHYHGEDYCFCQYYCSSFFFANEVYRTNMLHIQVMGMDP